MFFRRRIPLRLLAVMTFWPMAYATVWALIVYCLYAFLSFNFLRLPFLPVATIGTAVAFYVGFKNNASYDRFWEGRKIWGGIINESRSWANSVLTFVDARSSHEDAREIKTRLIYRQLAWVNALRVQLRSKSRFFDKPHRATKMRLEADEEHMRNDWDKEISPFLSSEEHQRIKAMINPSTQLLRAQSEDLKELHHEKRLDLFHQIALMGIVRELYALQGKCERIKNTPFPRQYAEFSRWFTRAFMMLVPCGLLSVFPKVAEGSRLGLTWDLVPYLLSAALVTWVFVTMEAIGDASEDPFERSVNDVPMNSLCRTIERDLRQMLGETELPDAEKPKGNLMY